MPKAKQKNRSRQSREAQPHGGGASPESVGEGAQHEPAAERAHSAEEVSQERLFSGISVLIALAGIGVGWAVFRKRPLLEMPRLLENKYYVDEVYDAAIINPIKVGSREGLWKIFDVGVIDGIVNGLGRGIDGDWPRRAPSCRADLCAATRRLSCSARSPSSAISLSSSSIANRKSCSNICSPS